MGTQNPSTATNHAPLLAIKTARKSAGSKNLSAILNASIGALTRRRLAIGRARRGIDAAATFAENSIGAAGSLSDRRACFLAFCRRQAGREIAERARKAGFYVSVLSGARDFHFKTRFKSSFGVRIFID